MFFFLPVSSSELFYIERTIRFSKDSSMSFRFLLNVDCICFSLLTCLSLLVFDFDNDFFS